VPNRISLHFIPHSLAKDQLNRLCHRVGK